MVKKRETPISKLIGMPFEKAFNDGNYYGFYDWFCKNSSLKNKSKNLFGKLKGIAGSSKFDPKKCYVFFKNNCPVFGSLYDDFRICDIKSGDVIYCVVPKSGHSGMAEVWGVDNDFAEPIVKCKSWVGIRKWFNS